MHIEYEKYTSSDFISIDRGKGYISVSIFCGLPKKCTTAFLTLEKAKQLVDGLNNLISEDE